MKLDINQIKKDRDNLVRALWCTFRNMSEVIDAEDFADEDMELWSVVTSHMAIQSRLERKTNDSIRID